MTKKFSNENATFDMICEMYSETPIHFDGLFSERIYFRDKTLIVGTTIITFASVIYYAFPPPRLSIGTF